MADERQGLIARTHVPGWLVGHPAVACTGGRRTVPGSSTCRRSQVTRAPKTGQWLRARDGRRPGGTRATS